jgi:hypothetical protein
MEVDVSTRMVIRRPRQVVADFAMDPDNAPRWYVNIKAVDWKSARPLRPGSQVEFAAEFLGRKLRYVYEAVELVPGERLVMRTAQGPFPMETTYAFTDADEGATSMLLRNRGRPAGFAAVLAPFMAMAMRRANRKDLACLKAILESG